MDERGFAAMVAEQAGLAKEEAADLIRATLQALGNQLSGGETRELALDLPDDLAGNLPPHNSGAHPVGLADFTRELRKHTGLSKEEVKRGLQAVLRTLAQMPDIRLEHALSQLPAEYRRLATATT